MTIIVEFECKDVDYNARPLTKLLRQMAYCAGNGASRKLNVFWDGDGSCPHIKSITVDGVVTRAMNLPYSEGWEKGIE